MKYKKTVKATFIERPNRFVAKVNIDDVEETVHVKNTGRCKELLLPQSDIVLEVSDNPNRKTKYDLISVYKKGLGWVNIDSQAPNKVVKEWLENQSYDYIKPEYKYGDSRIDFYLEKEGERYLLEVKGCTLEIDGKGYFPDAPTKRGVKHLKELIKAKEDGYKSVIAFVIAMEGINAVYPNPTTHPEFERVFYEAVNAGVQVWNLPCRVSENELVIIDRIH